MDQDGLDGFVELSVCGRWGDGKVLLAKSCFGVSFLFLPFLLLQRIGAFSFRRDVSTVSWRLFA
jgi:hypothetical protein